MMSGNGSATLLIGTRKGAFVLRSADRRTWTTDGPHFLGCDIHHMVRDPRDGTTVLMAIRTGHLGPTIQRSTDGGATWQEAERPPAFAKGADDTAPSVKNTFWLEPGHPSQPNVWWAGTVPHALFRSPDGGVTWDEVPGLRTYIGSLPDAAVYIGETPGGAITHSIRIDPRDARHLYVSLSGGGTFESPDEGATWKPLNKGVAVAFLPDGEPDYGHDPHCLVLHPANPDVLYQQNHCGIYRLDRSGDGDRWRRIGDNMPKDVGDIGFPMVPHPRHVDTVWVFPMDGTTVWPRTSPDGKPSVYRTTDGGESWHRQDAGFPREQAYWTVLRQAMTSDADDPVGLYFGTTSGEVWGSRDEGASWSRIAGDLPYIQSVTVAGGT